MDSLEFIILIIYITVLDLLNSHQLKRIYAKILSNQFYIRDDLKFSNRKEAAETTVLNEFRALTLGSLVQMHITVTGLVGITVTDSRNSIYFTCSNCRYITEAMQDIIYQYKNNK